MVSISKCSNCKLQGQNYVKVKSVDTDLVSNVTALGVGFARRHFYCHYIDFRQIEH